MIMTKGNTYKFAAAVLSLLAVACAKVEVVDDSGLTPVTVSTYGQRALGTKAGASLIAPGENFAAGDTIVVFGYHHPASASADGSWAAETSAGTNNPDFMYDQNVIKQEDGSWSYSPVKYWPNGYGTGADSKHIDKLSFWGYYPEHALGKGLTLYAAGSTTDYTNATSGIPKVVFTQNANPDQMIDLMLAVPVKDVYKTMAHTVGSDTWNYGHLTNGQVDLTFKHALALVEFELAEGTGAVINHLDISNIKQSGTLADPSTIPFVWSNQSGNINIHEEDISISTSTLVSMLVVPQTLEADALDSQKSATVFTLNYDITFASSDPTHPDPIVYKGDSFSVNLWKDTGVEETTYGVKQWEAGKRYVYKVTAGLDRIEFEEVVATDWSIWTDPDDSSNHEINVS